MVPMAFCVWACSPNRDDHSWQPLECVPPVSIVEYARRHAQAAMWLERSIRKDEWESHHRGWVASPPYPREEDIAHTAYPGGEGYRQGNCPDRPEVPTKLFTPSEVYIADNTLLRYTETFRVRPEWLPVSEVSWPVSIIKRSLHIVACCQCLTLDWCSQSIQAGEARRVPDSRVVCDPTSSWNIEHATAVAQGSHIFQFSGNASYNPQNAPQ